MVSTCQKGKSVAHPLGCLVAFISVFIRTAPAYETYMRGTAGRSGAVSLFKEGGGGERKKKKKKIPPGHDGGMYHVVHQLFIPLFCVSRRKRTCGNVYSVLGGLPWLRNSVENIKGLGGL